MDTIIECQKCKAKFIDGKWVTWNNKLADPCDLYKRLCSRPHVKEGECGNPSRLTCSQNSELGTGFDEIPEIKIKDVFEGL